MLSAIRPLGTSGVSKQDQSEKRTGTLIVLLIHKIKKINVQHLWSIGLFAATRYLPLFCEAFKKAPPFNWRHRKVHLPSSPNGTSDQVTFCLCISKTIGFCARSNGFLNCNKRFLPFASCRRNNGAKYADESKLSPSFN